MKNNTLIIFDWDDTLLPTTLITGNKHNSIELSQNYIKDIKLIKRDMNVLDHLNSNLLNRASNLGTTVIITNGTKSWVDKSGGDYLPKTHHFLTTHKIPVISARELGGQYNINNPTEWKNFTFDKYINYLKSQNNKLSNFISLGDSVLEKNALINTCNKMNNKYIKTVKYVESPELRDLIKENILIHKNINKISSLKRSSDIYLYK